MQKDGVNGRGHLGAFETSARRTVSPIKEVIYVRSYEIPYDKQYVWICWQVESRTGMVTYYVQRNLIRRLMMTTASLGLHQSRQGDEIGCPM